MTVTETNYLWYLVGDVALIYTVVLALVWIGNRVWWWYVGKVLGSRTRHHRAPHDGERLVGPQRITCGD